MAHILVVDDDEVILKITRSILQKSGHAVTLAKDGQSALQLLDQAENALALAQENWTIQKEPADARLVLDAARAAKQPKGSAKVREWLAAKRLEDVGFGPV